MPRCSTDNKKILHQRNIYKAFVFSMEYYGRKGIHSNFYNFQETYVVYLFLPTTLSAEDKSLTCCDTIPLSPPPPPVLSLSPSPSPTQVNLNGQVQLFFTILYSPTLGTLGMLLQIRRTKLVQLFSQHAMHQKGSPGCCIPGLLLYMLR